MSGLNYFIMPQYYVEDSPVTVRARWVNHLQIAFVPSDLTNISYSVFDITNLALPVVVPGHDTQGLIIADHILNPAVSHNDDDIWPGSYKPYNFLHVLPGDALPAGGHQYQIEYVVTLMVGTIIKLMPIRFTSLVRIRT